MVLSLRVKSFPSMSSQDGATKWPTPVRILSCAAEYHFEFVCLECVSTQSLRRILSPLTTQHLPRLCIVNSRLRNHQ